MPRSLACLLLTKNSLLLSSSWARRLFNLTLLETIAALLDNLCFNLLTRFLKARIAGISTSRTSSQLLPLQCIEVSSTKTSVLLRGCIATSDLRALSEYIRVIGTLNLHPAKILAFTCTGFDEHPRTCNTLGAKCCNSENASWLIGKFVATASSITVSTSRVSKYFSKSSLILNGWGCSPLYLTKQKEILREKSDHRSTPKFVLPKHRFVLYHFACRFRDK